MVHLWEVGSLGKTIIMGGKTCLRGTPDTAFSLSHTRFSLLDTPPPFSASQLPWSKQLCSTTLPTVVGFGLTVVLMVKPTYHDLNPLKSWAKGSSAISWVSSSLHCHSDGKQLNAMSDVCAIHPRPLSWGAETVSLSLLHVETVSSYVEFIGLQE